MNDDIAPNHGLSPFIIVPHFHFDEDIAEMHEYPRSVLTSCILAGLLLCLLFAQPHILHAQQVTPAQLDAIFRPLVSANSPGVAVGVSRHGKLVFARGYGLANLETKTPITPATDFRLASLTKQFTAMAIMLLVHDNKLHYNDTLTKVFPEFPAYGNNITIRELLNHTSGLKDYEPLYDPHLSADHPDEAPQIPQIRDSQVLRLLEQQTTTDFPPGSKWEYSNSGYSVLAMVVERVSGEPFEDFLAKRIFRPLHMEHTLAFVKGKNTVPNRAFGYSKDKAGKWTLSDQSPTSAVLGDGGIYTSIEDMAKWDRALANHTLLTAAEMQPAITPVEVSGGVHKPDGSASAYGFGWFLDPYKGHRRMWHYGETIGFLTAIQRLPDEGTTVIVLCNRTDLDPSALVERVLDLYLSK